MKKTKSHFIFICFILFTVIITGQDLNISSKYERVEVKEDTTFVSEVIIQFKKSKISRIYPIFYDTELEQISDIQLFTKKGKRLKAIKNIKTQEENVQLEYIASKRIKSIQIPENKEIHLKYKIKCKELMYFSSLHFSTYNKIDTLKYQIKIPSKFDLSHKTIHKDSLKFYTIDSTKTNNYAVWNIKVVPKKVNHDPLQYFGIYKNIQVPLMKTLVFPKKYQGNGLAYMNNWYLKNISTKKGLNYATKQKIDEITAGVSNKEKIIEILYNYIRANFKYVAIEIGMGAFIPSHVNEVFTNKQGDCKDLSNFLSEALNYKGIKSTVALAATFDHTSNCDFPSLGSANHVVCIASIDNKEIVLDPTDPVHVQETPVQSLQGRTVLVINNKGGKFLKVERFTPEQNKINYQINLKLNSQKHILSGNFDVKYNGISDNYLQRILTYENNQDFNAFINDHYESIFGNQSISNLTFSNNLKKLKFKGDITINGKTFNDDLNKYLFIDFIPKLIETENRETLLEGTYLNYPFSKRTYIEIMLDEPLEKFVPIKHHFSENGVSLALKITSISDLKIAIEYDFTFDHIFIKKHNIDITNKILKAFKKITNDPIIFKKKKI